jgi:hypothetical protein
MTNNSESAPDNSESDIIHLSLYKLSGGFLTVYLALATGGAWEALGGQLCRK